MTRYSEFQALVTSLGEQLVSYIGSEFYSSISVVGIESSNEASIIIVPSEHTPDVYDKIIDAVIDVRGMFMDEIRFDYLISDSDESGASQSGAKAVFATV